MRASDAATKQSGKIQQLFCLWEEVGEGARLPRAFAIELAVAEGINPWTATTQYQVWFKLGQPGCAGRRKGALSAHRSKQSPPRAGWWGSGTGRAQAWCVPGP